MDRSIAPPTAWHHAGGPPAGPASLLQGRSALTQSPSCSEPQFPHGALLSPPKATICNVPWPQVGVLKTSGRGRGGHTNPKLDQPVVLNLGSGQRRTRSGRGRTLPLKPQHSGRGCPSGCGLRLRQLGDQAAAHGTCQVPPPGGGQCSPAPTLRQPASARDQGRAQQDSSRVCACPSAVRGQRGIRPPGPQPRREGSRDLPMGPPGPPPPAHLRSARLGCRTLPTGEKQGGTWGAGPCAPVWFTSACAVPNKGAPRDSVSPSAPAPSAPKALRPTRDSVLPHSEPQSV